MNSSYQCQNAQMSYQIYKIQIKSDNIILIDNTVDSKWTLTVCGYLLLKSGFSHVYPFVLADTSQNGMN